MREPLRTIHSFTQLLERNCEDKLRKENKEYFELIKSSAKNMQSLINDLLNYARLSPENQSLQCVNLEECLVIVENNLNVLITSNKAQIIIEDLPKHVVGINSQIVQLFQNIIANAIKFRHPARLPLIRISCIKRENNHVFKIADNGIGIKKKFLKKVFNLFEKSYQSRAQKGSGIGMATCKKIIENHNGEIWVESEWEVGSTFYFTLPNLL